MKNLKWALLIGLIVLSFKGMAQDNVFLNRDFWKSTTTIAEVEAKIKEGHDIAEANSHNFDPVVYAINQGAPNETIKYIISKEGNGVNKLTHDGRTYIFWAARVGNTEIMEFLLDKGAKTDIVDDHGNTILNFAASSGQQNTKVYEICLANGADLKNDLNQDGANALLLAAPNDKDGKLTKYFVSKGLDINSTDYNGNGVFNYVARTGHIKALKKLLKKGIKGNDQAFIFAARGTRGKTNGIEVFQFLERVGLRPNGTAKDGSTALHALAARGKDLSVMDYFIEKGCDVNTANKSGNNPFIIAAGSNNIEVLQLLKKHLKDINAVNKKGQSALTMAVEHNSPEVVKYLIDNKADVSVVDSNGNTLVSYLFNDYSPRNKANFEAKLEILKANGLDFSKKQGNGNNLYHLAVNKQSIDLLKLATGHKANVNAKNNEGYTPLHLAAMKAKDVEILKYLLANGADKGAQTEFDETVYDLASENEILKEKHIAIDFLK